jgi:hypothetical protein
MKTKYLFLVIALLSCYSSVIYGQSAKEEIAFYQSIFGMEKKAVFSKFMQLESNDPFWATYEEYETERKQQSQEMINILDEYITNYYEINDEHASSLVEQSMAHCKKTTTLINKYYKKIKKTSVGKTAAKFYQLQNFLSSAIRLSLYESLPLIGELNN